MSSPKGVIAVKNKKKVGVLRHTGTSYVRTWHGVLRQTSMTLCTERVPWRFIPASTISFATFTRIIKKKKMRKITSENQHDKTW